MDRRFHRVTKLIETHLEAHLSLYQYFDFVSGGYYNIELAGSRLRLVSLNMNLYLEEVAEETKFLHHGHRGKDPASSSQNAAPVSSPATDSSDPEEQWAWLVKVMEEAKKKGQNVSRNINACFLPCVNFTNAIGVAF